MTFQNEKSLPKSEGKESPASAELHDFHCLFALPAYIVSWLRFLLLTAPSQFPSGCLLRPAAFVPLTVGISAPDFHRIPCRPLTATVLYLICHYSIIVFHFMQREITLHPITILAKQKKEHAAAHQANHNFETLSDSFTSSHTLSDSIKIPPFVGQFILLYLDE